MISADIIDFTQTRLTLLPDRFTYLCTGAQMFCPAIGETLKRAALGLWPSGGRVYGRDDGLIMGITLGPRFETPAEARWLQRSDCDLVGQSAGPEVFLAREIGACYASSSYVVNWVNGIREQTWELDGIHDELKLPASRLVLRAMKRVTLDEDCGCTKYRKPRPQHYHESVKRAGVP